MTQVIKDDYLFVAVKQSEPMLDFGGRDAIIDNAPGTCMYLYDYPVEMFKRNELCQFYDFDNPQSIYGNY